MGCDIHLRVQVQGKRSEAWRNVLDATRLGPDWTYNSDYTRSPASARNYLLFARLAGVRNDNRGVTPLFADRGAPEGEPLWDEDWCHSHTWATLAELLAADWGVGVRQAYIAAPDQYRRWRDDNDADFEDCPVNGREVITEAEFVAGEQAEDPEARAEFTRRMLNGRTVVAWEAVFRPLLRCGFVRWVNGPHAAALAKAAGGPERVRLLIAFDN